MTRISISYPFLCQPESTSSNPHSLEHLTLLKNLSTLQNQKQNGPNVTTVDSQNQNMTSKGFSIDDLLNSKKNGQNNSNNKSVEAPQKINKENEDEMATEEQESKNAANTTNASGSYEVESLQIIKNEDSNEEVDVMTDVRD